MPGKCIDYSSSITTSKKHSLLYTYDSIASQYVVTAEAIRYRVNCLLLITILGQICLGLATENILSSPDVKFLEQCNPADSHCMLGFQCLR